MLVHADRDDLVEFVRARDVAAILDSQFEALPEPERGGALAPQLGLRPAQGDAGPQNSVMTRRPACRPPPAAADVEQPLAGSETQFAAEMVELLFLGGVEVFAT